MIGARFGAIVRSGCVSRLIVGGITVCETIRHNQIDDVLWRDALEFSNGRRSRPYRQLKGRRACRCGDSANRRSEFGVRFELQPNEKVVSSGGRLRALHNKCGQVAGHLRGLEMASREQEHDLLSQTEPPIRWFDFCDHRGLIRSLRGLQKRYRSKSEGDIPKRERENGAQEKTIKS